jgi:hypothetical protein
VSPTSTPNRQEKTSFAGVHASLDATDSLGCPGFQEGREQFFVIPLARFQFTSFLRMQKRAILIKHKEVWIPRDLRVVAQKSCVIVFVTLVHFHYQKAALKIRMNSLVSMNELVQDFAPASPVPTNF